MRFVWFFVLLAAPASAQVVVSNCAYNEGLRVSDLVECEMTNNFGTAVRYFEYSYRLVEDGRSVPWGEGGLTGQPMLANIAGGIEPGETITDFIRTQYFPARAERSAVKIEINFLQAYDVNRQPIDE